MSAETVYPLHLRPMTLGWGVVAVGATLATSQTTTSGNDVFAVLVALITALGAVGAAWIASRVRRNGRTDHHNELISEQAAVNQLLIEELGVLRDENERLRLQLDERRRGRDR